MSAVIAPLIQYGSLEEAYPPVDPLFIPIGNFVLFQLRTPKDVTRGGIIVPNALGEAEQWNTQVAKVIKLGPVCFKNRDTLEPWPEGDWCAPGDFVRIPLHGGDRWYLPVPGRTDHRALFAVFRDLEVKGIFTGDPLSVDAFL